MYIAAFIFSFIFIVFGTLAVFGLVKRDNPKSGTMVKAGFVGLALSILYSLPGWQDITLGLKSLGVDYEQCRNLNNLFFLVMWLPTLVLLVLGIIGFVSKRADSLSFKKIGCFGAVIVFILTGATAPTWIRGVDRHSEAETKLNIFSIEVGLRRYEADKGFYPQNIDTLISAGITEKFPLNTYTNEPMRDVPYASPDCYGNFTYLPVVVGGEVRGYYLIAYGYKDREGQHLVGPDIVDHVILVAHSSQEVASIWPADVPFPDVKTVIEAQGR